MMMRNLKEEEYDGVVLTHAAVAVMDGFTTDCVVGNLRGFT